MEKVPAFFSIYAIYSLEADFPDHRPPTGLPVFLEKSRGTKE
jgi:hypothetical protein